MSRVTVVQIGLGTVGGEVISQVVANRERWRSVLGRDVQIGAVIGTGGAVLAEGPDGLADDLLLRLVHARREGK